MSSSTLSVTVTVRCNSQYQKRSRGQGMSVGGAGDVGEIERMRGCWIESVEQAGCWRKDRIATGKSTELSRLTHSPMISRGRILLRRNGFSARLVMQWYCGGGFAVVAARAQTSNAGAIDERISWSSRAWSFRTSQSRTKRSGGVHDSAECWTEGCWEAQ